jgi:methionyl-tRNA formyltransferase
MARIAVAATAPFGADVLERLAARHDVTALLTRPDAPRGRGRKVAPPPAKDVAERLGVQVLQPDRPEPGLDLGAPVVVVCAYGLLVPEELLAERVWLNAHPSLLPRWRGAAPVERAILAGDAETGVTIHETVKELDAGPIVAQERFPIGPDDDAGSVFARAAEVAARLLDAVLADPAPSFVPQSAVGVTYADKIEPADRLLDLGRPRSSCAGSGRSPRTSGRGPSCTAGRSPSGRHGWGMRAPSSPSRSSPTEAGGWPPPPGCAACADGRRDLTLAGGGVRRDPAGVRG